MITCSKDWRFPPGFKFGASTSAYQIEGSWNVSDKGESIWDRFTHTKPEAIVGGANGDIACDSYNQWGRDVEIAKELNLHFYRFSVSWPRILPNGFANFISKEGLKYYSNLIDGLLAEGIEPMVTMYHWDLPQSLQELGGWTNPHIVDWFGDYARVLYTNYGSRVKLWLTINEPIAICDIPYNTGTFAPGVVSPDHGPNICNKYVLLAHARAYRIYEEEFKDKYNGKLSIVNMLIWFQPWSEGDEEIAELANQNCAGRYSHAIYSKEGGWPPIIEEHMVNVSNKKGYDKCLLPAFTKEEIEYVRGTYDFYALNYYTSRVVRKAEEGEILRSWPLGDAPALDAVLGTLVEWPNTVCHWFQVYPPGIRHILVWLKKQYGDIDYYITENGLGTHGGLNDQDRIEYYDNHLRQVLLAIKEDAVDVTHYTAWSLMDNFEWPEGYRVKFGLYEVDFEDPKRTRTPRASAKYYANVIKQNALNATGPNEVRKSKVIDEL